MLHRDRLSQLLQLLLSLSSGFEIQKPQLQGQLDTLTDQSLQARLLSKLWACKALDIFLFGKKTKKFCL